MDMKMMKKGISSTKFQASSLYQPNITDKKNWGFIRLSEWDFKCDSNGHKGKSIVGARTLVSLIPNLASFPVCPDGWIVLF